jgi:hypothetical protein
MHFDNYSDVIDSREVIARIAELEAIEAPDEDDILELAALQTLAEEAGGYASDWEYGETLIRDSCFEEYARQLAEDCGMIPDNLSWPVSCIDWEQAARELQMDYTSVNFGGVMYWIR